MNEEERAKFVKEMDGLTKVVGPVRLTKEEYDKIKQHCSSKGITVSNFIRKMLKSELKRKNYYLDKKNERLGDQ